MRIINSIIFSDHFSHFASSSTCFLYRVRFFDPEFSSSSASKVFWEQRVILKHKLHLIHSLRCMIVAAISAFVTQFGFDLSQPLLCGFTHAALVHAGQEHLLQLVSKRADAGQHNIDLPVPLSEHGFRLAAGFFRRPLIRPLRKSLRQLEPFVNTVCVADHQTPMAAELAQHQSQIRYWDIPCPPRLPAMIHIKPMDELRAGVPLMIAVDAEKGTSSLNWFFCSRSQEPP